ncbi:MAG: DNA repair protein RecO [Chitinophagaceae bacterium]
MLHKTKGLVLRTVKYGETSLVVSIFTELFGMQSYLVNGVRTSTTKNPYRGNLFQPATILEMIVYHNELKNLQRIKEFKYNVLYENIYRNVHKNAVALFMTELIQKCLKQTESNIHLYEFLEDAFIHLDKASAEVTANYSLFFMLHFAHFFGFRIQDDHAADKTFLDLQEGFFVEEKPMHPYFMDGKFSEVTSQLLKAQIPNEIAELVLSREQREFLLDAYVRFYAYHLQDFGQMRSLPVLHSLFV